MAAVNKQGTGHNLRELVIKAVRDDILSGGLMPGKRLIEKKLAAQIGVSRTPVRDALSKLEQEGFVEIIPHRGAIVSVIKNKDIRNVLEIRGVLEALAARLSCAYVSDGFLSNLNQAKNAYEKAVEEDDLTKMTQRDIEFHDIIYAASGNEKLIQLINNLRDQIYRYRVTALRDRDYRRDVVFQHQRIFNALSCANSEKAAKAALDHINSQEKTMVTEERL